MEPPGQRKAIIEAHIAEIKINGSQLIPIFMIPAGNSDGSAETSTDLDLAQWCGSRTARLRHKNPFTVPAILVVGDALPVRLSGSRTRA